MKQTTKKRLGLTQAHRPALILLSASFALGALLACFLAASLSGASGDALTSYIQSFLTAARDASLQKPALLETIWLIFRWPLFVFLCSLGSIGLIGIPAVFFLRGFLFSFCVSAFVQTLGAQGLLFAVTLLGIESLLSIPVLFVMGADGLSLAAQAKGRKGRMRGLVAIGADPSLLARYILCLAALVACTLWEVLFLPPLIAGAAQAIPLP